MSVPEEFAQKKEASFSSTKLHIAIDLPPNIIPTSDPKILKS
jgi:hypothetical protein